MYTASRSPPQYSDTTAVNLNRLLSRLESILLSPNASSSLRKSSLERRRVGANVEYARTLLLNLEHTSSTTPSSKSKKAALQSDLQQKRELIKQLNQRLFELDQLDDSESEEDSLDSGEDQDQFPSYAPRIKEEAGLEIVGAGDGSGGNEALREAAKNLTSELRRRGRTDNAETASSTATASTLFPTKSSTTQGDPSTTQTEAVLSHNRAEQEAITTSLLEMAKQLKQQSVQFGATMEGDKGVLDRAIQGLDQSSQGMDAAGQRMGTLRRMTEGRGWWSRMKLYAFIFGLWVIAFLIVFVGPKIRF